MNKRPVDLNDLSKGYIYSWDESENKDSKRKLECKQPKRNITNVTTIWLCFQLFDGKTFKQLERKLKIYKVSQLKYAVNKQYETIGSTYMQHWTDFLNYLEYNDTVEMYYLRLIEFNWIESNLSYDNYEIYEDYLKDIERIKDSRDTLSNKFFHGK